MGGKLPLEMPRVWWPSRRDYPKCPRNRLEALPSVPLRSGGSSGEVESSYAIFQIQSHQRFVRSTAPRASSALLNNGGQNFPTNLLGKVEGMGIFAFEEIHHDSDEIPDFPA